VNEWTINDASSWLQAIQLDQYIDIFKKNHVDGYTLLNLTDHDLEVSPISLLHQNTDNYVTIAWFKDRVICSQEDNPKKYKETNRSMVAIKKGGWS
jgi:hypothetical protein